jgi:hypothetical protein
MIEDLLKCVIDEPTNHLTAFASYLETECDISPKIIGVVAEELMVNA